MRIELTKREFLDLRLILSGLLRPLKGFMGRDDLEGVLKSRRLKSGHFFPAPVVLSSKGVEPSRGDRLELIYNGETVGEMVVDETYEWEGNRFISGSMGAEIKEVTIRDGKIAGYITPGPIYRPEEYVLKAVLEVADKIFIGFVEEAEKEPLSSKVRRKATEVLLSQYFPKNRYILRDISYHMRYTKDDYLFHALILRNIGCSYAIIISGEPREIEDFVEPYRKDLGIDILVFEKPFYCGRCKTMATDRTCPHQDRFRVYMEEGRLKDLLRRGHRLPEEFARPEVGKVIMEGFLFGGVSSEEDKIKKSLKDLGYIE